jgi:hypothetical protein
MKVQTGLSIDSETLTRIDQMRGEVPRSRILERLINRGIASENAEKVGSES